MRKRSNLPGAFAALGMLILILDSKTALTAAREGLELCLRTVIPSLFPFFVLSGILVRSLMGTALPLLRPLGRMLGIPQGAESVLVSGFLGGYPVGAKSIHDAWTAGCIGKRDAERMLSFCSNAGPAFIFGMAAPMFSSPGAGWILWGIHIAGALFSGFVFRQKPDCTALPASVAEEKPSDAVSNALTVTGTVCGWVLVFRILCCFLERWFLFLIPGWAQAAVVGLLELANGCVGLGDLSSESVRFLLCSIILAFGGLCVTMQTVSVTQGLSLKYYFSGKLVQTLFSLLLSMMYLNILSPLWLLVLPLAAAKKKGKSSSILRPLRV